MLVFFRSLGLAAVAASLALTGCGGSNVTSSSGNCGAPNGKVALVYPANNSSGIPDNLAGVIFGSTNGLASSYEGFLLPAGSASFLTFETVVPAPLPLPSPHTIPPFPNPVYQESASGGAILPAQTQIGVYLNDGNSNCSPSLLGSFTTQ
jgi:hypothetical protein